jgi:hypothetical protein
MKPGIQLSLNDTVTKTRTVMAVRDGCTKTIGRGRWRFLRTEAELRRMCKAKSPPPTHTICRTEKQKWYKLWRTKVIQVMTNKSEAAEVNPTMKTCERAEAKIQTLLGGGEWPAWDSVRFTAVLTSGSQSRSERFVKDRTLCSAGIWTSVSQL